MGFDKPKVVVFDHFKSTSPTLGKHSNQNFAKLCVGCCFYFLTVFFSTNFKVRIKFKLHFMIPAIFYLSTIFIIFFKWVWIASPIEKTKDAEKFFKLKTQNKGKKWDDFSDDYKLEVKSKVCYLYVFVWLIIGLFTFQWFGFLAILLFNLVLISPLSKLLKFSFAYTVLHWLNSIIGLAFAIFTIINHYHLRIDLFQYFSSFFPK